MSTSKVTTLDQLQKLAERTKTEVSAVESKVTAISVPEYTLVKQATADAGYLSTYYLTKDNTQVGEKINIAKDFLVKSATLATVTAADKPYSGAAVGDKYIDFVINSKDATSDTDADHIYLAVNDLVDTYTAGANGGITISNKTVSIKLSSTANGLSLTANGLQLALATASAAGAMSASDKSKLDGITLATDTEVDTMLTTVFGAANT